MKNQPDHSKKDNHDDLIIIRPEALSPGRRRTELTLTAIGWLIWVVLCRPMVLVFLWFLGFQIFYEHMIRLGGLSALIDFTFIYLGVVFALYLGIRGWNFYNAKRFKGKDRRISDRAVSAQDLESFFHLDPTTVDKARAWKVMIVDFQDQHQISLRDSKSPGSLESYKGRFKPT